MALQKPKAGVQGGQGVANLVGDTGGKPAQRCQLAGVKRLGLERPSLGHVLEELHHLDDPTLPVPDRRRGVTEVPDRPGGRPDLPLDLHWTAFREGPLGQAVLATALYPGSRAWVTHAPRLPAQPLRRMGV